MKKTKELQVNDLSLEMKVCYFLQPWNSTETPRTVEEWAKEVGFSKYKEESVHSDLSAIETAIKDATYYIEFVKKHISLDN